MWQVLGGDEEAKISLGFGMGVDKFLNLGYSDLKVTTDMKDFIPFRDRHNRGIPAAQPTFVYNACHFQMLHFPYSGILDSKWYRSRSGKTRVAIVPLQTSVLLASLLCLTLCITLPHVYGAAPPTPDLPQHGMRWKSTSTEWVLAAPYWSKTRESLLTLNPWRLTGMPMVQHQMSSDPCWQSSPTDTLL